MNRVSDVEIRRSAVTTDGHAFVWASAGTGKTHTLTVRALYLILHEADRRLYGEDRRARLEAAGAILQRVVLTTFTRKAAAEMRHRLYSYLDAFASGRGAAAAKLPADPVVDEILAEVRLRFGCDEAALARGAAALAERAAELQISTLHSFAAGLLRRHPLAAGLPAGVHFAREDEDDLLGLDEQLIDRWWQTRAFEDDSTAALLDEVLEIADVAQLRGWLEAALNHPWLAEEGAIEAPPAAEVSSAVQAVRKVGEFLAGTSAAKMSRVGAEMLAAVEQIGSAPGRGWPRLQRLCRDQRGYLFRSGRPTKALAGFLKTLDEQEVRWFEDPLMLESLSAACWVTAGRSSLWKKWLRLIGDFRKWADEAAVRELGLVTFDEMIRRSVRLLEERADIRSAERSRLRALLVDEFQDTDPEQLRLIELLVAGPLPAPTGFFVGDLKQSIYRFRGADVDAISRFHRRFTAAASAPCRDFQLSATFRTAPAVARFANRLFGDCLELAEPAEQLDPVRDAVSPKPTWWSLRKIGDRRPGRYAARQESAAKTVELLRACCPSRYAYSEVLVLTRDHRELDALLAEMQAAEIPTVSSGARTFFSQPEVLDVLNLLIALHTPLDPLSVAALLRSPLVQLPDDQIHTLLEVIPTRKLIHGEAPLPEWVVPTGTRRIAELRRLAATRGSESTAVWLQDVSGFIPRTVYVAPHDREGRALVRINRVLEEFHRYVLGDGAPLSWLIRQRERSAAEDRFDSDLGEDVSLSDETLDAVRVMTIHKAKGLEARLVVVFGWSSVLEATESVRLHYPSAIATRDREGNPVRGFALPLGPARVISPGYAAACRLEEEGERREAVRLAYVAATRARDELVLLNPIWSGWRCAPAVTELLGSDPPPGWFQFDTARPADVAARPPSPAIRELETTAYRNRWNRLFEDLQAAPAGLSRPSDFEGPAGEGRQASGQLGLQVGLLVHAYLEEHLLDRRLEESKLDAVAATIEGLSRSVTTRSRPVLARFFAGECSDPSGRAYRDRIESGRVLGREVPLLLSFQGRRWSGTIDLVLEESDRIVAVDYKTVAPLDPLPPAYRSQQQIYLEGLRRIFPERPVDFEFWWLGVEEPSRRDVEPKQEELPF